MHGPFQRAKRSLRGGAALLFALPVSYTHLQRFTVKMPYGADYDRKLRFLKGALESGAIQSNQKGILEMTQEDGKIVFIEE